MKLLNFRAVTCLLLQVVLPAFSKEEQSGGRHVRGTATALSGVKQAVSASVGSNVLSVRFGSSSSSDSSSSRDSKYKGGKEEGALYIMTNAASGNEVRMHTRDLASGALKYVASFATDGVGAGIGGAADGSSLVGFADPLGASEPLINTGRCVLAVNAGSASVTTFDIQRDGFLELAGVYPAGDFPNSIAYKRINFKHGVVYVLGAGGEGSLTGFKISDFSCRMESVGAEVSLGQQGTSSPPFFPTAPAQVSFTESGRETFLAVQISGQDDVVGPGTMSLYPLEFDLTLGAPEVTTIGAVAFSFYVHAGPDGRGARDGLLVNAAGDTTVTNYQVESDGALTVVGGPVDLGVAANCWIQESRGCVATTNFNDGNGTVATLRLEEDGSLTLLDARAAEIDGPIDLRFSEAGDFLYVIGGGRPAIYVYAVTDCVLNQVQVLDTVPFEFTTFGVVGMALD